MKSHLYIKISALLVAVACFMAFSPAIIDIQSNVGTRVGNVAPDIRFPNPDGKIIQLSSLRGKLVLVDFWASWCQPCRAENPNLVRIYEKYKDQDFGNAKGFEIFSISLDQDHSKWTAAIKKDNLFWNGHVSDLKYWKSEPARIFGVQSIPHTLLINEKGVIIAKGLRGAAIERAVENYMRQSAK